MIFLCSVLQTYNSEFSLFTLISMYKFASVKTDTSLRQGSTDFLYKGPDGKRFRLCDHMAPLVSTHCSKETAIGNG